SSVCLCLVQARHRHSLPRFVDCRLCLRRHVVGIVLGKHLGSVEAAVGRQRSLRDDAFALLEQVGKEARVADRYRARGIGHTEVNGQAVAVAGETACLDHAADAKRAAARRFVRSNLRRGEEEHEIGLERVEHQRSGDAEQREPARDPAEAARPGLHCEGSRPPATRRAAERRARTNTISAAIASAHAAYEPQTYNPYPPMEKNSAMLIARPWLLA